jgi:hypothetical protein
LSKSHNHATGADGVKTAALRKGPIQAWKFFGPLLTGGRYKEQLIED